MKKPQLFNIKKLAQTVLEASSLILTTHKQCDGDGLGSQLGLYHALKKINKNVRVICVDGIPEKYEFLNTQQHVSIFENPHSPIEPTDLGLIFDTNDYRLIEPLFAELQKKCQKILFIDHHPILKKGPLPTEGSFIDTDAASTGEITYNLIKELNIPLDLNIARALYTSIAFDTQVFRYIKNSPASHLIAADLLKYENNPKKIHQHLFSNHSKGKIKFLATVLNKIEFIADGKIAFLDIHDKDVQNNKLKVEEVKDVIDMIMNVAEVEAAAVLYEYQDNSYKLSLRSKGFCEILSIAEGFGGGGHAHAAGSYIKVSTEDNIRKQIIDALLKSLNSSKGLSLN